MNNIKIEQRKFLANVTPPEVDENKVVEFLADFEPFLSSKTVFCYMSMAGEFPTKVIVDECKRLGKKVYLPVVIGKTMMFCEYKGELRKGAFDILEPADKESRKKDAELCFVPGVAFSVKCERLGRGGGYYDKFLKNFKGYKLGLCFSTHVVDIAVEAHDILMDNVLTEEGFIEKN